MKSYEDIKQRKLTLAMTSKFIGLCTLHIRGSEMSPDVCYFMPERATRPRACRLQNINCTKKSMKILLKIFL